MEDLRYRLPITGGKKPELDPINRRAEAEPPGELDFRGFLRETYTQASNRVNDRLKTDRDISSGTAERVGSSSEKIFPPIKTSQSFAIHSRSKEIGRVIFTGVSSSVDMEDARIESLNPEADEFLSGFFEGESGSSKAMVDHIRETMLGAAEVASSISRVSSGGEINKDQLGMLKSSNRNSWPEFTQQISADPSRSLPGAVRLTTNEPQFFSSALDVNPAESGGANKEQVTSNIGQSADLAKLLKPSTMDFVIETRSSDHDSTQSGLNGSRGESGDHGGNQRDSEKQDADGQPSGSERDRQAWRERFAEIISDRIKVKVDEGEWLVRMNLQAPGLGRFDISLKSDDSGVFGSIHTDDPQVKELLNSALPELERALNESLSSQGGEKVRLKVSDGNSLEETEKLLDSREIVITASELSNSLPERFKAGDGLDVFV